MKALNLNATVLASAEKLDSPVASSSARRDKSLYMRPPRLDIEGWAFIAQLAFFIGASALSVLGW